jgi:hypothetical protein
VNVLSKVKKQICRQPDHGAMRWYRSGTNAGSRQERGSMAKTGAGSAGSDALRLARVIGLRPWRHHHPRNDVVGHVAASAMTLEQPLLRYRESSGCVIFNMRHHAIQTRLNMLRCLRGIIAKG